VAAGQMCPNGRYDRICLAEVLHWDTVKSS
jgi:hypothetical protein